MLRKLTARGSFIVVCAVAPPLAAQQRDPAAAQALFDQARALMKAQNYAEACPKLAESQRLDPGIGTQFHLADCFERQGKVASAWANFLEVASLAAAAGQADRERAAKARAAKLEGRLPRLTIVVPAANRVAGLEVRRNGALVGESQWGSAVPVDPGDHQLTASAPGLKPHSDTVNLREGLSRTLQIPALVASTQEPVTAPAPAPAAPSAPAPSAPAPAPLAAAPAPADSTSGPSGLVIGLGVVGVVGLGAGAALGLMASSKYDDSKTHCDATDENRCSAEGVSLRDDAFTLANLSTAGFVVGGLALAGAGVLWLTSGPEQATGRAGRFHAGVQMGPARSSLLVRGSF